MSNDNGLLICGALLGFVGIAYANFSRPTNRKKIEKQYAKYRDDLKKDKNVFNSTPTATLLGIDIEDRCSCGNKVKKYDEHKLVINNDGTKWFRMCSSCIHKSGSAS